LNTKNDVSTEPGQLQLQEADFYLSREGKPTGTLLVIAFEATKLGRPSVSTQKEPEAAAE
jgi:hypothetical protein